MNFSALQFPVYHERFREGLESDDGHAYGVLEKEFGGLVNLMSRLVLENISNFVVLYHDIEHDE
jgi:hypothetical protein